jgi:glutathione S-transferase
MLTVYGRATSSNVQLVMWGIAELGLTCERLDYGHVYGGTDTPAFRAMNPNGLVPVLRDGDLVMWESSAILRYLAARYGGAPFWPADPVARAPIDMWAEWGRSTLVRDFARPIFWASVRTPPAQRDESALASALNRFDANLTILEDRIGDGPWLLGRDFTLADLSVGHLLYRYFTLDIVRAERPRLAAYYHRLTERPAFAEHVMVSYEPLRAGPG